MEQFGLAQGQSLIRDKRDLYEALVRNQYHLPKQSAAICTVPFMHEVRQGAVWCPMKDAIRAHTCLQPPSRAEVQQEVITLMQAHVPDEGTTERASVVRFIKYLHKREADRAWLLDVLYTCTQGTHLYFGRDYRAPPRRRGPDPVDELLLLNNADGFFSGLPPSRSKSRCASGAVLAPAQRQQLRQAKMRAQISRLEGQLRAEMTREARVPVVRGGISDDETDLSAEMGEGLLGPRMTDSLLIAPEDQQPRAGQPSAGAQLLGDHKADESLHDLGLLLEESHTEPGRGESKRAPGTANVIRNRASQEDEQMLYQ